MFIGDVNNLFSGQNVLIYFYAYLLIFMHGFVDVKLKHSVSFTADSKRAVSTKRQPSQVD